MAAHHHGYQRIVTSRGRAEDPIPSAPLQARDRDWKSCSLPESCDAGESRTSNSGYLSRLSRLALQYAVILVTGVERHFGSCAGSQPPKSHTVTFEVDLI
jgi:hypothetical protein